MNRPIIRYQTLDALRAGMMLLGIALHASIPYIWPATVVGFHAHHASAVLTALVYLIHVFRMPAFFYLSGFFSALVFERRGFEGFLTQRIKRIGVVGFVAWVILFPITEVVSIYSHFASEPGTAWSNTTHAILHRTFDRSILQAPPMHLWFLEYLLIFCIVAAISAKALGKRIQYVDPWTTRLFQFRFRTVALAIPTAVCLSAMPLAYVPYPASFRPWPSVLLIYGWFYAVGWFVYRRPDLMPSLERGRWGEIIAAPILLIASMDLAFIRQQSSKPQFGLDAALDFCVALAAWCVIFGSIAIASKLVKRPSSRLAYAADASYWLYLAHFPIVSLLPALLRNVRAPATVMVFVILAITTLILLSIYELGIRYTWVGTALNGPRVRTQDLHVTIGRPTTGSISST